MVKRAAVFLVSTGLLLLIGELGLRARGGPHLTRIGWKYEGLDERNDFGFRGRRLPAGHTADVLLVGDSQVEGVGPSSSMPEVYLARELTRLSSRPVDVLSVAGGGWGQDQELLALRQVLSRQKPALVCLWFTPENDFWNNTFPTHYGHPPIPKPTFWLDSGQLRGPNLAWLSLYQKRSVRLLTLWDRLVGHPAFPSDDDWVARLPQPYTGRPPGPGHVDDLLSFAARVHGPVDYLKSQMTLEDFKSEKNDTSIFLIPRSRRLQYSIDLTRALLRDIYTQCLKNHIAFVVFYVDVKLEFPEDPIDVGIDGRVFTFSGKAADDVVRETLADIPHLAIEGPGYAGRISSENPHLTQGGNEYIMNTLARQVRGDLQTR